MRISRLILLSFAALFLVSCAALKRKEYETYIQTTEKGIPKSFGVKDSTLLVVLSGRNKLDDWIIQMVQEKYHGDVIFIKKHELEYTKFLDTEKYRFVLFVRSHYGLYKSSPIPPFQKKTTQLGYDFSYSLHDRLEDKPYPVGIETQKMKTLLAAHLSVLEMKRSGMW